MSWQSHYNGMIVTDSFITLLSVRACGSWVSLSISYRHGSFWFTLISFIDPQPFFRSFLEIPHSFLDPGYPTEPLAMRHSTFLFTLIIVVFVVTVDAQMSPSSMSSLFGGGGGSGQGSQSQPTGPPLNPSAPVNDSCKALPFTKDTWNKLGLDHYLQTYPGGANLSVKVSYFMMPWDLTSIKAVETLRLSMMIQGNFICVHERQKRGVLIVAICFQAIQEFQAEPISRLEDFTNRIPHLPHLPSHTQAYAESKRAPSFDCGVGNRCHAGQVSQSLRSLIQNDFLYCKSSPNANLSSGSCSFANLSGYLIGTFCLPYSSGIHISTVWFKPWPLALILYKVSNDWCPE